MGHAGRAYSRSQILDHVWGTNAYLEERTVDVHIRRLEKRWNRLKPVSICKQSVDMAIVSLRMTDRKPE